MFTLYARPGRKRRSRIEKFRVREFEIVPTRPRTLSENRDVKLAQDYVTGTMTVPEVIRGDEEKIVEKRGDERERTWVGPIVAL